VAESDWYELVKYLETSVNFTDTKVQLVHNLGPEIDIGPAMAGTSPNSNGKITHKINVISLTLRIWPHWIRCNCTLNMTVVRDKLGVPVYPDDYKDDPGFDIPIHEADEDDHVPSQAMADADDGEHDVDTYDQYVGTSLHLPIGDDIRAGRVTGRKRELDETMLGRLLPIPCWIKRPTRSNLRMGVPMRTLPT
jgi:hypothetical protein